ncbi:MAG: oligosaccharide flippase family protein [Maritimibacter harenae]|jgi:O-antigen/teichoic acid export membrane protein
MLKSLAAPYVVGVASRVVGQVISFCAVAVASRYLDLEGFGVYAYGWALTVIATTFVFTGFYQSLLRSQNFERDRHTLFWAKLAVGALGMAVIFAVGLLHGGTGALEGRMLILLAPLPFVIVPTAWWEAQMVREAKVRAASIYVVVSEALGLAAAIALLERGWGAEALVASRYVSTLAGLVITGSLVRALPRVELRGDALRDARQTATSLWGTTSVGLLTNYGADLVLGAFLSPSVVGAYRGGARIAMTATNLVLQPLGLLSWSKFTRIEKEGLGKEAMRRAWHENMSLAASLLWPMAVAVGLLAPALVVTLLDETWLAAASIVAILSLSKSIAFFSNLLEPTMLTTGNAGQQLRIRATGAVTLIALLIAFGRFGPEQAAYAHLGASVVVGVLSLIATKRALEFRVMEMVRTFLPGIALAGLTYGAITGSAGLWDSLGTELGLGLAIAVAAVVWSALMLVFLRRRVLKLPTP